MIMLNGLTGVVNIDSLALTASRNDTIKPNLEEFRESVKSQIRPKIIESLNLHEAEGMITARFAFIVKVAKLYGYEVLHESSLPWISIFVHPGSIQLFNAEDAARLIASRSEIIMSYGTGPWSTVTVCREYFPEASDSALIIPINDEEQPSFGHYSEGDQIVMNVLPKQLRVRDSKDSDEIESEDYKGAIFLTSLLKVISIGWNIDEKRLINSQWLRKSNKHLCVHFKKCELK
jgi:hypothetical protein